MATPRQVGEIIRLASDLAYMKFSWLLREMRNSGLHPVVQQALIKGHVPTDKEKLALEWPHPSGDGKRLAYTASPDKGERDIQTVTSPGKYLRRHFPDMKDHDIRDLVALGDGGTYNIVRSMQRMIEVIENGPSSCMAGESEVFQTGGAHPYEVYDPKYGWGLAVYTNPEGRIDGRALVLEADKAKCFVRSYRRCFDEFGYQAYSEAHEGLEAWLRDQGYEKKGGWPLGTRLAYIEADSEDDIVMPYIDGSNDSVKIVDDGYVEISSHGVSACSSEGVISAYRYVCSCCDRRVQYEDDLTSAYEGDEVCSSCLGYHYTRAHTIGDEVQWVRDSQAVLVGGEYYHEAHLDDNDIVYSSWDGEHYKRDDVFELSGEAYVARDQINAYLLSNLGRVPEALEEDASLSSTVIEAYREYDPDNAIALGLMPDPNTPDLFEEPEESEAAPAPTVTGNKLEFVEGGYYKPGFGPWGNGADMFVINQGAIKFHYPESGWSEEPYKPSFGDFKSLKSGYYTAFVPTEEQLYKEPEHA